MHQHQAGFSLIKVLLSIIVLAIALGVGLNSRGNHASLSRISQTDLYQVKKTSFDVNVIAEGELNAKEKEEVRSPLNETSEIVFIVEEGQAVSKGDLLVKFNDTAIREELEETELEVQDLKGTLEREQRDAEIEVGKVKSELEAAQVQLELTKLDVAKWKNGDVVQKLRDLDLALQKAQREQKRAAENVVLSQKLYQEEFISEQELEDDRIRKLETEAATKTATMNIAIYRDYTYKKEEQQKESDLSQAQAKVSRAKAAYENTVQREDSQVAHAKYRLQRREERVKEYKEHLANTKLFAPKDGLVIYATSVGRSRYRRETPISEGSKVQFNEAIIYLPDTALMVASVKVHEAFLRYVAVGQQANVTIEARPDRPISGEVSQIAVAPEPTSWYSGNIREYRVTIDLDQGQAKDLGLKPGMRSSAKIHIEHVKDALAVPVQSVETIQKRSFVYVYRDSIDMESGDQQTGVYMTEVSLGQSSDTLVEIRSGLDAGDQILMRRPSVNELLNPDEFTQNPDEQEGSQEVGEKQYQAKTNSSGKLPITGKNKKSPAGAKKLKSGGKKSGKHKKNPAS